MLDEIVSVEIVESDSLRYDITVADNHNFFAEGVLVHNCQNCYDLVSSLFDEKWTVEEKLDGASMTVGIKDGDLHVCSRNLSLKLDDENNSFIKAAKQCGILDVLRNLGRNIAISGELCGEGIQGNKYLLKGQHWFVFDIFDVDSGKYVSWNERQSIIADLVALGATLRQVPCIFPGSKLTGHTVDSLLELAEGKAWHNTKTEREGLVFKNENNPDISFKAISNRFLIKNGE
jgi:RNA ligase (TIGR02306 family)